MKIVMALLVAYLALQVSKPTVAASNEQRAAGEKPAPTTLEDVNRYKRAIVSRVRRFIVEPPGIKGNPEVEVLVEVLPGGEVLDATVTRSSGQKAWDNAVLRGIQRAQPLPLPPADSPIFKDLAKIQMRFRPN